jgi:hypothetical protein
MKIYSGSGLSLTSVGCALSDQIDQVHPVLYLNPTLGKGGKGWEWDYSPLTP